MGDEQRLHELFDGTVAALSVSVERAEFVHHSTASLFDLFTHWFGPVAGLLERLEDGQRDAFARDWIAMSDEHNVATDGTCEIASDYLQVVAVKRPSPQG